MKLYISILIGVLVSMVAFGQNKPKVKRKTPEPGTKLSLMSKAIVGRVTQGLLDNNPDSAFMVYDKQTTFRRRVAFKTIDTLITDDSLPVRIYYPHKAKRHDKLPVLIFYHGGAFLYGTIETYNNLAGKVCRESRCIVVLPEYRLAPEYPFPYAVNDAYATYTWTKANIGSLGGDNKKISLIGDSAGANLSAVTVLKAYNNGDTSITSQCLIYPNTIWADTLLASREYFSGKKGPAYVIAETVGYRARKSYLQEQNLRQAYASPYYANYSSDMPPAFIITAGCDPLRDEGELLVEKMKASGMQIEHTRYKKMIHGFVSFYKVMPKGKKAIRESVRFANKHFE